jgi:hypothetical protein
VPNSANSTNPAALAPGQPKEELMTQIDNRTTIERSYRLLGLLSVCEQSARHIEDLRQTSTNTLPGHWRAL